MNLTRTRITNQERVKTIDQLQAINESLINLIEIFGILPLTPKSTKKDRPASTKRHPSEFEVVDAAMKKKAKTLKKT
jgi:hypothetical protein